MSDIRDEPWRLVIDDGKGNRITFTLDEVYAFAVWVKAHLATLEATL